MAGSNLPAGTYPGNPKVTLNGLGQEIDALRQSLQQTVVERAAEIGERLIMAKRIARHGQWLPWLRKREMSERSAQNYMKMARHLQDLRTANPKRRCAFVQQSLRRALWAIQEKNTDPPAAAAAGSVSLENARLFREHKAKAIGRLTKRMHGVGERFGSDAVVKAQIAYKPSFRSEVTALLVAENPAYPLTPQGVAKATSGGVIYLTAPKPEQDLPQAVPGRAEYVAALMAMDMSARTAEIRRLLEELHVSVREVS